MKTLTVLVALFACTSCISEPRTEFTGPHGRTVASVGCNEWGQTMDDCQKHAATLCPAGYETIHLASGADDVSKRGGLGGMPTQKLTVECK